MDDDGPGTAGLRLYLVKGGFLIVDDFKPEGWRGVPGGGWEPFRGDSGARAARGTFFDMDPADPDLPLVLRHQDALADFPQAYNYGKPVFRGVYEDNDRSKRLLMIINYNTDISQVPGSGRAAASGRSTTPTKRTSSA